MRKYEAVYIFLPNLEEEVRNKQLDRLKGVIEDNGEITTLDEWGNRKLAYLINDIADGYYVLINFKAEKEVLDELDRVSKISDIIMRHMIIREDE